MDSPFAPAVSAKLDGAVAALAALESQSAELALAALEKKPGAEKELAAHRGRLRDAEIAVNELRPALKLAEKRDALAAVEERHKRRQADLEKFIAAGERKLDAVKRFCAGAKAAAEAYCEIRTASFRLSNLLPSETAMPRGMNAFSAEAIIDGVSFPANAEALAASELYRHSGIDQIGEEGALPAARSLTASVMHRPNAVESWSESTARVNAYLARTLRVQIDFLHRAEIEKIEMEYKNG